MAVVAEAYLAVVAVAGAYLTMPAQVAVAVAVAEAVVGAAHLYQRKKQAEISNCRV